MSRKMAARTMIQAPQRQTVCSKPWVWPRCMTNSQKLRMARGSMIHQRMVVVSKNMNRINRAPSTTAAWVMKENEAQGQPDACSDSDMAGSSSKCDNPIAGPGRMSSSHRLAV